MDYFKNALDTGAFATINPNSIAVFALLCCRGEVPPTEVIASQLGMIPSRVCTAIADLKKRRLIGEDNSPVEWEPWERENHIKVVEEIASSLKDKITKDKTGSLNSILTEQVAPAFGRKKRHSSGKAYRIYKEVFEEVRGKPYTLSIKTGSVYCKRLLTWLDDDLVIFTEVCEFYLKNWEKIKEAWGLYGKPHLNLLASGTFFGRLREAMETGFIGDKRTLLTRYKEDASPEVGFGE